MIDPEIKITHKDTYFEHELILEEKTVSGLAVWDLEMRIGVASVRMGGIGGVGTDDKHRNKGYSRRVLENSNAWMEAEGFDCATLFGIPDYYPKFGYGVCLLDCGWEVRTREAERANLTLTVRPSTEDDLPVLRDLYAANSATLTGSIVRGEKTRWFAKGSRYGHPAEGVVFTDASGQVVAYAARDKEEDRVMVCEVGASSPEQFESVLRWAADRAVELRLEKITFQLPPGSLLADFLTQYGAKQTNRFPRQAGGMGRLLNLNAFLEKTLPEWTRRASQDRKSVV